MYLKYVWQHFIKRDVVQASTWVYMYIACGMLRRHCLHTTKTALNRQKKVLVGS